MSRIDEAEVLENYKNEVRAKAATTMTAADMDYIEEDLCSPCTQEIAVFRAFAEIVERAENEIVVIDTAPTGHTPLLLDATERCSAHTAILPSRYATCCHACATRRRQRWLS